MIAEHLFWLHFMGLRDARDGPEAGERAARPAPRRRHLVELVRGAGRPLDDDRVVRRAEDGRRRRGRRDARLHPAARRHPACPRVHEVLPRPARPVAVAARSRRCRRRSSCCRPASPFSIYNLACWARQTVVPLSVVMALRPSARAGVDLREIGARPGETRPAPRPGPAPPPRDRRGRALGARAAGGRRRLGRDPAAVGVVDPDARRRSATGSRTSSSARRSRAGAGSSSTRATACGPRHASRRSGTRRSPLLGLRACGVPADHPQLVKAGEWLLGEEIQGSGRLVGARARPRAGRLGVRVRERPLSRRRRRRRGLPRAPRARAWARTPSTAAWPGSRACSARTAAGARSTSTTRASGSTGSRSSTSEPSSTRRARTSPAHAVEALAPVSALRRRRRGAASTTCSASSRTTAPGGAAGASTTSTGPPRCCPALEACGLDVRPSGHSAAPSAGSTRSRHENGGFGEDIRSYHEREWRGRGVPTASQTAWGVLAYVAAGEAERASARRAADHLCASQLDNGDWEEEHYTGTGFPTDFMIRYHLYRLHFPLMALGRLRERLNA